jgi:hypothetical protein
MNVLPHLAIDPALLPRPSARVATVAELLDCDPGDIRRLIRDGELETHGKGKRGLRVYLDSVRDYQVRQARQTRPRSPDAGALRRRAPASTAAHLAAMASLRAKGIV